MELTLAISILATVISVSNFVLSRKDKAISDNKENNRELIDIKTFEIQLKNVQEDLKEMKTDMRDIKQMFMNNKETMREIAKEVVHDSIAIELQKHVDKYHNKEK